MWFRRKSWKKTSLNFFICILVLNIEKTLDMKKLLTLIVFVLAGATVASAQAEGDKQNGPQIKFEKESHDFGKINEGVVAEYDFKFTNTGTAPLILTNVRPSCGCTTPDWPKDPIQPGKSSVIKVKYNSVNRPGAFHKSITVTSNIGEESKVLFIKGDVTPSPDKMTADPNQSPVRVQPAQ